MVVAKISTYSRLVRGRSCLFSQSIWVFSSLAFSLFFRLDCAHRAVVQYRTRTARLVLVLVLVLCATPCDVTLLFDLLGSG